MNGKALYRRYASMPRGGTLKYCVQFNPGKRMSIGVYFIKRVYQKGKGCWRVLLVGLRFNDFKARMCLSRFFITLFVPYYNKKNKNHQNQDNH